MLRITAVATLLLSLVAVACTSGAGTSTTTPPTAPAVTAGAPSVAPQTPSAATGPTLSISAAGYFVGPNGMTLYTFDKDTADATNCVDQCATTWPVLSVSSADQISVGDGVDSSLVSTITRSDGALQVTFNHAPLYFFSGDTAPGNTNGVYTLWRLATPGSIPGSGAPSSAAPSAGQSGEDLQY